MFIVLVLANPCVTVSFGTLVLCTVAVTHRRHHALIDMRIVEKPASVCGYDDDCSFALRGSGARMLFAVR